MEAIYKATPKNGILVVDNKNDYIDFLEENEGIELEVSFSHTAKLSEKKKMYNYLFGPVMACSVEGFTKAGWEGVDRVKARYLLQAEFGKIDVINHQTGEIKVSFEEIGKMPKARLLLFIQQCLHYLEDHLQQTVPDSQTYKLMKLTGRNFTSTKKR